MKWINLKKKEPEQDQLIEAVIEHFNADIGKGRKTIRGRMGDDGFYMEGGWELSYNWDIVKWRPIEIKPNNKKE